MIIHDNSIKKIVEHRKNELSENIDTYVLKLYPNIGTYTIFEFHYVHTDNISIYIYIYIYPVIVTSAFYFQFVRTFLPVGEFKIYFERQEVYETRLQIADRYTKV